MKANTGLVLTAMAVLLATPSEAKAYLDPGTGSMVFQIAIGGALAAIATCKLYWRRLQSIFSGKSKDELGSSSDLRKS